ncbi:MAG: ABC transporter substrate-binding protein [Anaerolineales bacterium]
MRTRPMLFVLLLVALIVLPACQPGGNVPAEEGTIKVGLLFPMSGDVATFGQSSYNGALLAIEEWNEQGGVMGKQIEPILEDGQCSAEAAVSAANKLIEQDGVQFIVGEVCSSASIPVSEIAVVKGVLQISGSSTNPAVTYDAETETTKDTIFRACFIDPFQGKVAARFAREELDAQTAAVFLDQGNDYVRGLAEVFAENFEELGGEVVVMETYTGEDTDFSAILTKVKDAAPDVLYLPDYYSTVNLIHSQAREMGIEAVTLGGDGWDSAELDLQAAEGGYYTNHYSPDDPRPVVQDWVARYEEEYGAVPDALATLAYDATSILLQAMADAESTDPAVVADAMESGRFSVVSGDITFDEQHNPIKSAAILKVENGSVVFVDFASP